MDFVKTLLLMMSLTFAANVQNAPVPEVTIPPTSVPVVVTLVPEQGLATPTPTVRATATPEPVPTITPNRSYSTLQMGDKGNAVKRLQTRLIELGYLSGSADGAYGQQTKTAVRLFQKENGLTRDGIAGRETQTALFENPDVKPNPAVITPTPEPTPTPDASGLVPLPEKPLTLWTNLNGTRILLNGSQVILPNGTIPEVYRRGMEIMIGLNGLAAGTEGWVFYPGTAAQGFDLVAAGNELTAIISDRVSGNRTPDDASYCDVYTLTVNGTPVTCNQGDLVSEQGAWYISGSLLQRALGATVNYDEEERTLLLTIPTHGASLSED